MIPEEPKWMKILKELIEKAPEGAEGNADMPKPQPGRQQYPLPLPRAPVSRAPKKDRFLTEREKMMYKQFKGTTPKEGMMLSEFRRYMGQVRKRGGFKA